MLGNRIKRIRLFKGMTQEELVDGIASIAYLSKVENGQSKPSIEFVTKISDRLEIDADVLLNPSVSPQTEENIRVILYNYWKRKILSEKDVALIRLYSSEMHSNKILLMTFSVLIRYFYSHSRLTEAKEAYHLSKKLIKLDETSKEDSELVFYYLFSCGVLHFELYEYAVANKYFLFAEPYLPNDDDREKARLYYNLSLINEKINIDKSLCLHYSDKAYQYMKRTGETNRIVNILLVRSIQFYSVHLPEKAMECTSEAQNLLSLSDRDDRLKSSIVFSFGEIYLMKGDYLEAIKHFTEYIKIVETVYPEKVMKGYKRLVEICIHQRQWDHAANFLDKAQAIAKEYTKVFFDKEIKLLEIQLYKIQQLNDKYEKEMQKLLTYCSEQKDYHLGKYLASELGVYFHDRQAYKKSASYFKQAYDIESEQKKENQHMVTEYRVETVQN